MAECLLSMHEVQSSIPSTGTDRQSKTKQERVGEGQRAEAELCNEYILDVTKIPLYASPAFSGSQKAELYRVHLLDSLALYI